jgi:hypothetical protein
MKQTKSYFLQFSLLSAGVGILFYVLLYLSGAEYFLSLWAYLAYVIYILFAVLACISDKKINGGYIEFSEALKISFGIFAITSFATTIFSYVLLNFIDTDFRVALDRYSIEAVEKMMTRFGVPQEEIDKAIKTAQNTDNFSIGNMLLSFAFTCILWFLFSLIIAAIVKKKKPLIDFTSIKSS